jgi:hypothetical protein
MVTLVVTLTVILFSIEIIFMCSVLVLLSQRAHCLGIPYCFLQNANDGGFEVLLSKWVNKGYGKVRMAAFHGPF